jgi:hypothetical protein
MTDLSSLEALARAATPGEWQWWTSNSWRRLKSLGGRSVLDPFVNPADKHPDLEVSEPDMAFIATLSPPTVLELVARLRAAERALRLARDRIAADRAVLFDSHVNQHTGRVEDPRELRRITEYDEALAAIDAAVNEQKEA